MNCNSSEIAYKAPLRRRLFHKLQSAFARESWSGWSLDYKFQTTLLPTSEKETQACTHGCLKLFDAWRALPLEKAFSSQPKGSDSKNRKNKN